MTWVGALAQAVEPSASSRLLPIASEAWSGSSVNMLANSSHTLFTHGAYQFAAYYDADGRVVLARRALDSEEWTTRTTGFSGKVADAHCTIALIVDGSGFLHVAWNHHGNPLHYARGTEPLSLELGPEIPMTGEGESKVTYPSFYLQNDGNLLFLYRDGYSGRGNVVLKHYDCATCSWSMVQPNLLSGEGRRNAYFSAFMDSQGTFHLAWTWRETPDVSTNHDLCYARSRDGGKTWTDSQDKVLPLPVTAASAEYAARIPQGSSLMNPPSVAAGSDGVPVIANYWISDDSGVPQWHLVRWQKEGWQTRILPVRRIPFVLGGTATKRPPISRASLLLRQNEDHTQAAFLVYRDDEQDGCVVLLSCPDLTRSAFHVRKLTSTRLDAWEPSVDSVQWARLGEVHLLLQEVHQPDGSDQAVARAPTPIASLITRP